MKVKQNGNKVFQLLLILLLVWSTMNLNNGDTGVVHADGEEPVIEYVSLAPNIKAVLHNVSQLMDVNNIYTVSFTIEIKNNSNSILNLVDYWAKIKSTQNVIMYTKLKESDRGKGQLGPNQKTYLTFYTQVGKSVNIDSLSIDMIKWDFSFNNYEQVIGTLSSNKLASQETTSSDFVFDDMSLVGELIDYHYFNHQNKANVSINISLKNKSIKNIDISELEFMLQTENGNAFETIVATRDKTTLTGLESKIITITAEIPIKEMTKKLVIVSIETESTSSKIIPTGEFVISNVIESSRQPLNTPIQVYINGKAITMSVQKSALFSNGNMDQLLTQFSVTNSTFEKLEGIELNYYYENNDGALYPLLLTTQDSNILLPKVEKKIQIKGDIPSNSDLSTSRIVAMYRGNEEGKQYMLGSFEVKTVTPEDLDTKTYYQDFEIRQESLLRSPNELFDIVISEIKITNQSEEVKSKLNLSGSFVIDGVMLEESVVKLVEPDNIITVGPNQTYSILAFTNVPYNQSINYVDFILYEKDKDNNLTHIKSFKEDQFVYANVLESDTAYHIGSLGKRGDIKLLKSGLYDGLKKDFFYAELEYTNKELRSVVPTEMSGYVKNRMGSIIPLQISKYDAKILPNEKLVLSVWAEIPRKFEKDTLQLFFGEAFVYDEGAENSILKPVYTNVVLKEMGTKSELMNLGILDYTLSMKNVKASFHNDEHGTAKGIRLDFDYDAIMIDDEYREYSENPQLMIELVDHGPDRKVYSKELLFDFDYMKENTILVGEENTKTVTYEDSGIVSSTDFSGYTLNIYTKFQDEKVLLATKDFKWFITNP